MKSTTFFRLAFSICLVAAISLQSDACGPLRTIIPTPEFFGLNNPGKTMADYERDENLRLWQSLTSEKIPLSDIEEAVYKDLKRKFMDSATGRNVTTGNLFYSYLSNTDDYEIVSFLYTAKELEEKWTGVRSPWYYPAKRYADDENTGDFSDIIETCKHYNGERLKDRYALQMTRALFASRQYDKCIAYSDSAFADIPDSNLMKRMARRYAAGCWNRLGDIGRADSIFALTGDIMSVTRDDRAEFVARINPDAPQLMEYIRGSVNDTAFMLSMIPVAQRCLADRRVRSKGDWNFLLAYIHNEFQNNESLALKEVRRSVRQPFSSDELRDLARCYKMKLNAKTRNTVGLLADLQWLENLTDPVNPDAKEWIRRCRNIVYEHWVPQLWKIKDFSTAILLAGYADNLDSGTLRFRAWEQINNISPWYWIMNIGIDDMRQSERYFNQNDYGCLSFQIMGSLTSGQLAQVYDRITSHDPLYNFLRRKARYDRDYYYELIGTLALREENYSRAVGYLSGVSHRYLKSMNIDKGGYLSRDPFCHYRSRWEVFSPYPGIEWEQETASTRHRYDSEPYAKLKFARQMQSYKEQMKNGSSADERGMARLMYAIGRRNSFEECWALTQYVRGYNYTTIVPTLQYWEDDFSPDNYGFLYDYENTIGHKTTEAIYEKETAAALDMLATDEARAKANYILGNLATVVKRYGDTPTGKFVKTSCDNWRQWL